MMELLLVVILVGTMAALSFPVMSGQIRRVRADEAIATLGSIRAQLRSNMAQTGAYDKLISDTGGTVTITAGAVCDNIPPFNNSNLSGTNFIPADYTITAIGANTFTIQAKGSKQAVAGVTITIDQDGKITTGGY